MRKPTVLFVDDEPNILAGLRRLTRSKRDVWDLRFAEGPEAALDVIHTEPVDVLVSDMRMPGMDGAALLEKAHKAAPTMLRVILSGEADEEMTFRTIGLSHQFIAKPCEADVLIEAIRLPLMMRALAEEVCDTVVHDDVSRLVASQSTLGEIDRILRDPAPKLDEFVVLVRTDPCLATRMLHLANSAYFGRKRTTINLDEAVRTLGIETLKALASRKKLVSEIDPALEAELVAWGARALELAEGARQVAVNAGASPAVQEECFTLGLLARIGDLANTPLTAEHLRNGVNGRAKCLLASTYISSLYGLPPVFLSRLRHLSLALPEKTGSEAYQAVFDAHAPHPYPID